MIHGLIPPLMKFFKAAHVLLLDIECVLCIASTAVLADSKDECMFMYIIWNSKLSSQSQSYVLSIIKSLSRAL